MLNPIYNYTPISRDTSEGKRHYCLPDGSKVASVTTILDKTKPEETKQALENWRNRIGHKQAQAITSEAANRGTRMHTYLEHYIINDDMKDFPSNPYAQTSWFMASEVILKGFDNITEFWGNEVSLYYSGLYAGTTDGVGIWKGKPAIIDFKQTNKPKKKEWIGDYFMQTCAYAHAHNNMFGTTIDTGVIMMCSRPDEKDPKSLPTYQEFVIEGDEFIHWSNEWNKRVEMFYNLS